MPEWLAVILLIAGSSLACFVLSGVVPRHTRTKERRNRSVAFLNSYAAYLQGDAGRAGWLAAHSLEMQEDAESVGLGIVYIAPPPMLGGGNYVPHAMFADIFNRQSYAEVVSPEQKIEVLQTAVHQVRTEEAARKRDVLNPAAWLRLTFERLVGFPRYLLRTAGFSERVVESSGARIITVIWGIAVGAATIGGFVVAVIALSRSG